MSKPLEDTVKEEFLDLPHIYIGCSDNPKENLYVVNLQELKRKVKEEKLIKTRAKKTYLRGLKFTFLPAIVKEYSDDKILVLQDKYNKETLEFHPASDFNEELPNNNFPIREEVSIVVSYDPINHWFLYHSRFSYWKSGTKSALN